MTGMALLLVFVVAADDGGWNSSTGRSRPPVRSAADGFSSTARDTNSSRDAVSALPPLSGSTFSDPSLDRSMRVAANGSWRDIENVLTQPAPQSRSSTNRSADVRTFGAAGKLRVNLEADPLPEPPRSIAGTGRGAARGVDVPLERGRVRSWLDEDPSAWELPAADSRAQRNPARRSVARVDEDPRDWSDSAWDGRDDRGDSDRESGLPSSRQRSRSTPRSSASSRDAIDDLVDDPLNTQRGSRWRDTSATGDRVSDPRRSDARTSGSRWADQDRDYENEPEDELPARDRFANSRSPNVGVFLPREYQSRDTASAPRGYEDRWADDRFRNRDYVTAPPREERIEVSAPRSSRSPLNSTDPYNVGPILANEEPGAGALAGNGNSNASNWPFDTTPSHTSNRTPIEDPPLGRTASDDYRSPSTDDRDGRSDSATRSLSDRPWWPFLLALIGLFASLGFNVYLGWIAWDLYTRYQDAIDDVQELEQRMEKQQAALDAGPLVSGRPSRATAIVG